MAAKNFSRSKSFLHKRRDNSISSCCTPKKSETVSDESKRATNESGCVNLNIDSGQKKKSMKNNSSRSKSLSFRSHSLKSHLVASADTNASNTSKPNTTRTTNENNALPKLGKISRSSRSPKKAQKSRSRMRKEKPDREQQNYKSYGRTSDVIRYTRLGLPLYPDPWLAMSRHLHAATRPGDAAPAWMHVAATRLTARALAKAGAQHQGQQQQDSQIQQQQQGHQSEVNSKSEVGSKLPEINHKTRYGGGGLASYSNTDSDASLAKPSLRRITRGIKKHCVIGDGDDDNNDEDSDNADEEEEEDDDDDDSDDVPANSSSAKDASSSGGTAALIEYDEDDDEEGGVPQAVRALNPANHVISHVTSAHLTTREILRERQRACMEEIARQVAPENLLDHLRVRGFLQADYGRHTRANSSNSSLRAGKKRPIEKLMGVVGNGRITQTFTASHH